MKHDPSLYIGLSQDGFLPPETSDPLQQEFEANSGIFQPLPAAEGKNRKMLGYAIAILVFGFVGYIFWSV